MINKQVLYKDIEEDKEFKRGLLVDLIRAHDSPVISGVLVKEDGYMTTTPLYLIKVL